MRPWDGQVQVEKLPCRGWILPHQLWRLGREEGDPEGEEKKKGGRGERGRRRRSHHELERNLGSAEPWDPRQANVFQERGIFREDKCCWKNKLDEKHR